MKREQEVPISRLREVFNVNAAGELFWAVRTSIRTVVGKRAGCVNDQGYRMVGVDGVPLRAHRVVFAMAHDRWPAMYIDHINGIRDDNRPENLREATHKQNMQNCKQRGSVRSPCRGVNWDRAGNRFRASLSVNGKTKQLGSFKSMDAAKGAYDRAANLYYGEFAKRDV